jgi:Ca-activated chloride channel family protein
VLTFLTPWPAIVAAAIAVPVLVAYYLLKLRRRPVRVSSTLLWEQATRDLQVNVPLRLIRPTWLFLLQLLALALLLLALARPALNAGGRMPSRVILLIDRSASMQATDGDAAGRSRLDEAKDRSIRTIDSLSRGAAGTALAVVAFAKEPAALTNLSEDRGAGRAAVRAIEASEQPGDLGSALRLCSAMMAQEADESQARRRGLVVLFSDGGFAQGDTFTLTGADFRFERIGPALGEPGAPTGIDNVGIVALSARRDWDEPGTVRLFARVQNGSLRPVAATLVASLDGKEVQRVPLVVPGTEEAGAGQASATFRLSAPEGGLAEVTIDRRDSLAADNTARAWLPPATKPRVLLVIPDGAAGGVRGPEWILTDVLEEMHLPTRVIPASAFESDAESGNPLRADLVIFDRVAPAHLPRVPTLSFGAAVPAPGLEMGAAREAGTYFLTWSRTSPLLRHVSLDGVYVKAPMTLRPLDPPPPGSPSWSVLAVGAGGPLIVQCDDRGIQHVVVGFELAQSNWPLSFGFPVFLASALESLSLRSRESAGLAFSTAEPAEVPVTGPGRVEVDGPRRLSLTVPDPAPPSISAGVLDRAGVYRLSGVSGAPAMAVNLLDPTESLAATSPALRVAGETVTATAARAGPREVWHWAVLAALLLLGIEWLVNAWMMRS